MKTTRGKILTFANPKGGVGKSTLSCLITAMLEWSNKYEIVQLIDADKQGSSVSLLQRICKVDVLKQPHLLHTPRTYYLQPLRSDAW